MSKPAVVKAKQAPKAAASRSPANLAGARPSTGDGDGDQIQQGDQSTPDTAAEQAAESAGGAAETESATESEQGQPGEPAVGHADAPGQNVNHDCTGDCVE